MAMLTLNGIVQNVLDTPARTDKKTGEIYAADSGSDLGREHATERPDFPSKRTTAPKSAKVYLNFVLLVASHRNADAKIIAFMDSELKKSNPEYKKEITIFMKIGN